VPVECRGGSAAQLARLPACVHGGAPPGQPLRSGSSFHSSISRLAASLICINGERPRLCPDARVRKMPPGSTVVYLRDRFIGLPAEV